ncbi:hypothetical protein LB504_010927 [Fusarium proliferatum]|nr:hypothetical protein LB504_010927 [Fusarium proliferatum]
MHTKDPLSLQILHTTDTNIQPTTQIDIHTTTVMSVELPADQLEVSALREKVQVIEGENKYANDLIEHLQEENGEMAIEIDELKKKLALAEERLQKFFDFWRLAEEELTRQLDITDDLKKELQAAKVEAASAQEPSE